MLTRYEVAVVLSLGSLSTHGSIANAQQTDSATVGTRSVATFRGRVTHLADGSPVNGADVWLVSADRHASTDSTGVFRFDGLTPGLQLVQIRRVGLDVQRDRITLSAERETVRTYALTGQSIKLDTVHTVAGAPKYVSPNLRGFEERRRLGMGGYFLSDSVLRREENRKLGDVVRSHMPGAMLQEGFHSSIYLLRSPRCVSGGPPQVYLDGVPLGAGSIDNDPSANSASGTGGASKAAKGPTTRREQNAAEPPFDLSDFEVSNLAGVEYYPDDTSLPVEFNHSSERCGALLLWTRER